MQAPVPETQKKADSRMKLIWKRVRRHPFLKLTAVLIAILFWMIVIASDPTLERQKEMTATVSVTGADTLRSRGYVVTDDLTSSPITTVPPPPAFRRGLISRRSRPTGSRRFPSPPVTAPTAKSSPSSPNR